MKRKTLLYILMIGLGLFAGWLIFAPKSAEEPQTSEVAENGHEHTTIWTCAMHPQIRQNEPGKCPICGMDLTPLQEGADADPRVVKLSESALKLADVQTTTVGTASQEAQVQLTGKLQIPEAAVKQIPAHFHGRIEGLNVNVTGETVKKGQILASIYSPELLVAQKELLVAYKNRDVDPVLYRAARAKLKNWKISETEINRILQTGEVINTLPVRAHHSGVVLEKNVDIGDHVKMGDVMFEIAPLGKLWAEFDAYESDLAFISVGDKIEFTVASVPGETFTGEVTFIDPVINPETRTATVRTEIKNPDKRLKPDMFASGTLKAEGSAEEELAVPASAIMWTGPRSVVYVKKVSEDGVVFEFREVKVGPRVGDMYIVKEGLQPGEEVVTKGTFTIDAAAQLNNTTSMMNRDVQVKEQVPTEEFVEESDIDFSDIASDEFKRELGDVVHAYLDVKNALVASDPGKAKTALEKVRKETLQANEKSLTGPSRAFWKEKKDFILNHVEIGMKAKDIAAHRENFVYLSQVIIKITEAFDPAVKGALYVDYCPMANNNKGAYWLSEKPQIENPFMPETMISCGEVKDTIQ